MDGAGARVNRLPRRLLVALAVGPVAGLAVFYAWPFVTLVVEAVTAESIARHARRGSTWEVVWFTAWQAVLSTVVTIAVGLAPAYVLARFDFRGRTVLVGLLTAMFVLPTVVMGAAFLALLPDCTRPHRVGGDRRPRRVQPRSCRARGRIAVGAPPDRHGGRRRHARRVSPAGRHADLAAARAARGDRGRHDRVPVHLHLVRGDPDPRCARHPHDRGRGVASGNPARRRRRRRRAGLAAARGVGGDRVVVDARPAAPCPGDRAAADRGATAARECRANVASW